MKEITLTQGKVAIVDDEDFEWLNQWKWQFSGIYATRRPPIKCSKEVEKTLAMHKEIMNTPDGMCTDHINHDPLDNRRSNLRVCTQQENRFNNRINKNNTSGYKGVSYFKRDKKWMAGIAKGCVSKHLGYYDAPEDAAKAYDKAAVELFGEYAALNFPLDNV